MVLCIFVYCREQKSLLSDFLYVLGCDGKKGGGGGVGMVL